MRWARFAHLWLASLVTVALVVQFLLAGAGAFGATTWERHRELGQALIAVGGVLLVLALFARVHRAPTLALLVLLVLQLALALLADELPWLGALHAVNALVVLGVAHATATRAWRASHGRAPGPKPESELPG